LGDHPVCGFQPTHYDSLSSKIISSSKPKLFHRSKQQIKMNSLFVLASVALLFSIAADVPELESGLQLALDRLIQVVSD
jgi:hypothetical protein